MISLELKELNKTKWKHLEKQNLKTKTDTKTKCDTKTTTYL